MILPACKFLCTLVFLVQDIVLTFLFYLCSFRGLWWRFLVRANMWLLGARFEEQEPAGTRSFFTEIIASISDIKFARGGRYILSRDYMTLKVSGANLSFLFTLLSWFYKSLHSVDYQRDGNVVFFFLWRQEFFHPWSWLLLSLFSFLISLWLWSWVTVVGCEHGSFPCCHFQGSWVFAAQGMCFYKSFLILSHFS